MANPLVVEIALFPVDLAHSGDHCSRFFGSEIGTSFSFVSKLRVVY